MNPEPNTRLTGRLLNLKQLIRGYTFKVPFHHHFQHEAAKNRQWGSSDRRFYRHASYSWFRLGRACESLPFQTRLAIALYLNPPYQPDLMQYFADADAHLGWLREEKPLDDRLEAVRQFVPGFHFDDVFPASDQLSAGIEKEDFIRSLWEPRALWLKPGKSSVEFITAKLSKMGISFDLQGQSIAVPNGSNVEELVKQGHVQVMDLSSQAAADLVQAGSSMKVWDCCAGAGGKSLYIAAKYPGIELYSSDIRNSALENLSERFTKIQLRQPYTTVADLGHLPERLVFTNAAMSPVTATHAYFDGIVLDAPCTGSGTWGRTPESLRFFKTDAIAEAHNRQVLLAQQVLPFLKPGGTLWYMTCSAYAMENEGVVSKLGELPFLKVKQQRLLQEKQADTLFVAEIEKLK